MKAYDPKFDIFELQDEIQEIIKEVFNQFLKGNKDYLQKVCGESVVALFNIDLKRRETEVQFNSLLIPIIGMGTNDERAIVCVTTRLFGCEKTGQGHADLYLCNHGPRAVLQRVKEGQESS